MTQSIVQIDAFSSEPFKGNPAAVCLMSGPAEESWMQSVAAEMNLSETAFLYRDGSVYQLRWFTPAVEVDLCGHATLASAHHLFEDGHVPPEQTIRFQTRSGELTARKDGEWIELDFPTGKLTPTEAPAGLTEVIGAEIVECHADHHTHLVMLKDEATVRQLTPDFSAMLALSEKCVLVTAESEQSDLDFVSRFFAPGFGINEDPVTGSAHTLLGPFWAEKLGKTEFSACQASARGGFVRVRVEGERVLLGGRAVTVMRGELL